MSIDFIIPPLACISIILSLSSHSNKSKELIESINKLFAMIDKSISVETGINIFMENLDGNLNNIEEYLNEIPQKYRDCIVWNYTMYKKNKREWYWPTEDLYKKCKQILKQYKKEWFDILPLSADITNYCLNKYI